MMQAVHRKIEAEYGKRSSSFEHDGGGTSSWSVIRRGALDENSEWMEYFRFLYILEEKKYTKIILEYRKTWKYLAASARNEWTMAKWHMEPPEFFWTAQKRRICLAAARWRERRKIH